MSAYGVGAHGSMERRGHRVRATLSPIQRATWDVAVSTELAEEGEILLSASSLCDDAPTFEVDSVSTSASGFLAVPVDLVVWGSLDVELGREAHIGPLRDACLAVAATGMGLVRIAAGCSARRGQAVLLHITRTPTGLCLALFCPEACERQRNAVEALMVLMQQTSLTAARSSRLHTQLTAGLCPSARARVERYDGESTVLHSLTTYAISAENPKRETHSGHRTWLSAIVTGAAVAAVALVLARVAVSFVTMD